MKNGGVVAAVMAGSAAIGGGELASTNFCGAYFSRLPWQSLPPYIDVQQRVEARFPSCLVAAYTW